MAHENLPQGGTVYYGHSKSSVDPTAADFTTAMSYLTGATGHITVSYVAPIITIRYDWMPAGTWIAQIRYTADEGFAYSIYVSKRGDVFARLFINSSPQESPDYSMDSQSKVYKWNDATSGISTEITAGGFSIFKLASTDIRSGSENSIFVIPVYNYGTKLYVYPDSVTGGASSDTGCLIPGTQFENAKFTVLAPIFSAKSSGVATYARSMYAYSSEDPGLIPGGAYTIGGYNYQLISPGYTSTSPILLANE